MKKNLFYLLLGGVIFTAISVTAEILMDSSQVSFSTNNSEITDRNNNSVVDVQDALDLLNEKKETVKSLTAQKEEKSAQLAELEANLNPCEEGKVCVKKVETDTDTPTEYDINGEKFIVIWSNQYETALISKYNVSTSTRKQVESGAETLAFSTTRYWFDTKNVALKADYTANGTSYSGKPYPYVYNSQSNLYTYLNDYKTYLNSSKVKLVRLATYEEIANLGCTSSDTCPSGIKNTSFWTGSADVNVWFLAPRGSLMTNGYLASTRYGVRPVIVVSTSEL